MHRLRGLESDFILSRDGAHVTAHQAAAAQLKTDMVALKQQAQSLQQPDMIEHIIRLELLLAELSRLIP